MNGMKPFSFFSVLFAIFPVLCGPWLKSTLAKVIRLFDFYHVYIITDCINKCIAFVLKLRIKNFSIPIVLSSSLCVCVLRSVTFSYTVSAFQDKTQLTLAGDNSNNSSKTEQTTLRHRVMDKFGN